VAASKKKSTLGLRPFDEGKKKPAMLLLRWPLESVNGFWGGGVAKRPPQRGKKGKKARVGNLCYKMGGKEWEGAAVPKPGEKKKKGRSQQKK